LNGNENCRAVNVEAKKESAQTGTFLQPDSQQTNTGRAVHTY
jgi:hypothetical protein